jgi:hypothetical protein
VITEEATTPAMRDVARQIIEPFVAFGLTSLIGLGARSRARARAYAPRPLSARRPP